jgi:NADH-quinone oxidoreductase subunit G
MKMEFMTIDKMPVEIGDEKNILELIRKVGIELPTFCYYSDLSVYGACRMCVVEDNWGTIHTSCSTPPKAGMEVRTNTPRLRKYRKMILELLLSSHCRDCTTCTKSGTCKLQELAQRFGITTVRFNNTASESVLDNSSPCIIRDKSKCILCGDCVRMCDEVQNVGAIDFAFRGSNMCVSPAFDEPIADTNCVGCGQCAAVCPTGAIVIKSNRLELWNQLSNKNTKVLVQIAPAVRFAVGKELGLADGEDVMGKIVAALRRMGFDQVFDTVTGADLTVLEETNEFVSRLQDGGKLPLFTSCCPAWVRYAENNYPHLMGNVSTCRSPMQMFGSVLKEYYKDSEQKVIVAAIMPCTAKKHEAARDEFKEDGIPYVDYVITTQGLLKMIKEAGIIFADIEPEAVDMPFGTGSGAGVIFGVTGGVTEAVIRRVSQDKSTAALRAIAFTGVRGMDGVKEANIEVDGREIKIAVVSGLKNADDLIKQIEKGEKQYDFIEVMACPGGCVCGAGQPVTNNEGRKNRSKGTYKADRMSSIKCSEENLAVTALYEGLLKGKTHKLLHVHYHAKE